MHVIRLEPPVIDARTATFQWTVTPATELYAHTTFTLRFPDSVNARDVSPAIWWRVALICLHPHWAFLRPCQVVLPVRLPPGEREFWLRVCDAQVVALEAQIDGSDTARTIDLVESGAMADPLEPGPDEGIAVACFSGGRDSLTQAGLLHELGERHLLVAVSSPREGSVEHETPRRRHVMSEIVRRRGVELVEVESDFRGSWRNDFAGATRYRLSVNEVTDTQLFFAAALAVAAARGARSVWLASEAEVQESTRIGGAIVQHRHFMYSAVTQRSLQALLAPAAIRYAGLTYPLLQFQVQRVLATRYADLRDLQYSCWELTAEQSACSRCHECGRIAFNLLADGVDPSEIGIDLATLLQAPAVWTPRDSDPQPGAIGRRFVRYFDGHARRCLKALPVDRIIAALPPGADADVAVVAALRGYERIRATALEAPQEPEPGYRAGYLTLVDERLRPGLGAILDEHFEREPSENYAGLLDRTLTLSDWIAAPLARPELDRRATRPRANWRRVHALAPDGVQLAAAELEPIADCIPDPEPPLVTSPDSPALRVAETLLDGNELRYVAECVKTNWVSSAGPFVPRFEAAFAAASGCRHGSPARAAPPRCTWRSRRQGSALVTR